jgi:hypothetical protein
MASTYVNDLRLNEMATGDGSGTWGTTTNTNLELIAEAFSYGTEVITTNADTHTTTIADGATDPGRSLYLKYTGTLDSACTITIGPNTVSKVWIIENGTSGSQNIILSQGSGANITIPAGDTKVVYSDGAGAGAAFFDAFASLSVVDLKVQDDLTVTDDASIGGDATITGTLGVTGDITGTLATAAQTNITSVGTLTGLTITAATPSIQMTDSDNNADAYIQATDGNIRFYADDSAEAADSIVTFNIDGSERMRIDSSGNVGIGVTPSYKLDVSGASGVVAQINGPNDYNAESGLAFSAARAKISGFLNGSGATPGSSLRFYTMPDNGSVTSRMRIDSSGNVGIGTDSPDSQLHVDGNFAGPLVTIHNTGGASAAYAGLEVETSTTGTYVQKWLNAGTELGRFTATGNLFVGTTTPTTKLTVSGQAAFGSTDGSGNGIYLYVSGALSDNSYMSRNSAGSGTTTWYIGNQSITTSSDARLKDNIVDSERNAVEIINNLRVVDHTWNDPSDQNVNNKNSRGVWTGLIAQEAVEHIPWLVNRPLEDVDENGYENYWHMDYGYAVPLLIKAIQEQQTIIESLTARITTLEG